MNHDSRGLIDRKEVVVFEENLDWYRVRLDGAGARERKFRNVDRQHVAGRDSRRDPASGSTIDADGSPVDPRLHPGAGC
jgi:hypothetical protein